MSSKSQFNYDKDRPTAVEIQGNKVLVTLADGRVAGTALALHPWLAKASAEQQANYQLWPFSVDWPDLDEGLDIEWVLNWQPQPE